MSYTLDAGATTSVNGTSINVQVTAAAGNHTVQVTAEGDQGAACPASVAITVPAPAASRCTHLPCARECLQRQQHPGA